MGIDIWCVVVRRGGKGGRQTVTQTEGGVVRVEWCRIDGRGLVDGIHRFVIVEILIPRRCL